MSDSMYDKLGDLLKDALEKGEIPKGEKKGAEAGKVPHDFDARRKNRSDAPTGAPSVAQSEIAADTVQSAISSSCIDRNAKEKNRRIRILNAKEKKRRGEVLKSGKGAENARAFELLPDRILKAYEALGVKAEADESEIRSAYCKKLKRFHPDSNAENETVQRVAHKKTEEIVEAYNAIVAYKASRR